MNLLTIALITAAVLTLLSLAIVLITIGLRLFTDRRLEQDADFRKRAVPLLHSFLNGESSLEVTSTVLHKEPREALRLLMETSETLDASDREKLHTLIATLPFEKKELSALRSKRWQTRLHAAERLGYVAEDSALPQLMMALGDDVMAVRFTAAKSLVRLGCHDAVVPIIQALDIPGELSQRRIAEILSGLGDTALEPILGILRNPSSNASYLSIAARVAGMMQNGRLLPYLQQLLRHEHPNVRLNSVRALASIGNHSSIVPISKLGEDPSWEVRSAVMHALGKLDATGQIPLLIQGLSDQEWWVRYNAAQGLTNLGGHGMEALQDAATNHVDAYGREMSAQILQEHGIPVLKMEAHS